MKINYYLTTTLSTLALSTALGFVGTSATNALSLNGSSGQWSNAMGSADTVELKSVEPENQVLWGIPTDYGKSGLGFTGVGAKNFALGDSFLVGTLRHFNHPIYLPATAVDLTIELEFSQPLLTESFTFTLEIDETINEQPCRYPGISICPDKIFFANTIASNKFELDGASYTLKLLGFTNNQDRIPINEMISEELGSSEAEFYIVGQIASVSESTSRMGLLLLGIYLLKLGCPKKRKIESGK